MSDSDGKVPEARGRRNAADSGRLMAKDPLAIADQLEALAPWLLELAGELRNRESDKPEAPPSNGDGARLLTAGEVAQRTGLPKGAVYRLARAGGLGAVRLGTRTIRFNAAALDAWLSNGGLR